LFESYGSDELGGIRRSLKGIPSQLKVNGWNWKNLIRRPFQLGDFKLAAETYEIFEGSPAFADTAIQKIYVISLGACGRKSDGAKFAAKFAADEKCTPADKARFLYYQAILSGKPTDNILKNISLTRKEQSEVILSAARQCLTWNMSDLSEKFSAQYDAFFAEKPERIMNVMYSEKTIDNIDAWRKIYPKLDKQMCDIPFKGSMDFLETDVATGNRSIHFEKNSKTSDRMEVSSVCDRNGFHIFLRVQSDKSRAIEQGFANGIGTEMYFSAGKNQPYICIGSEPKKGVSFIFHTAYNNKTYQRENKNDPKNSFRDEVQFTDSDYVLHLFFSWQDNFDKLPAPGHDYRFECLSWCPDGGFSWGGSQGIHAASSWGSLRFSFTDKQLAEIRRELIFSAYKKYKMVPKDPHTSENLFEIWADKEIGDPEFYRMKLAPLECELDYYAKMVKQDMSDEEVTEVYTKALPRWKSLKHIVDQLRWEYLNETINDENI